MYNSFEYEKKVTKEYEKKKVTKEYETQKLYTKCEVCGGTREALAINRIQPVTRRRR